MPAIKHNILLEEAPLENGFLYYFNFEDYVNYTEQNKELYIKDSFLYLLNVGKIYNFLSRIKKYNYGYENLHVVNLQRGLGYFNMFIKGNKKEFLNNAIGILDDTIKYAIIEEDKYLYLYHNFYQPSYMLRPKWLSGMAQGQFISLSLRIYKITKETKYLSYANKAFNVMTKDIKHKGCSVIDDSYLWIEEYVNSNYINNVLNGNIFSILSLFDFILLEGDNDKKIYLENSLNALKIELPSFMRSDFSLYDRKLTIADESYNDLHYKQLQVLYDLTNDLIFKEYSKRFKMYAYKSYDFTLNEKIFIKFTKIKKIINYLVS